MTNSSAAIPLAYTAFGPTLSGCEDCFDFTLVFEESFFSIALSASVLIAAVPRLLWLARRRRVLDGRKFQLLKLGTIFILGALRLALLIVYAARPLQRTETTLAAAVLSFVSIFSVASLSFAEHGKSQRPSSILGVYFLLSVVFDVARVRSIWFANDTAIAGVFTVSFVLELALLILESQGKGRWITGRKELDSPEEIAGIFSRWSFWWINRLFLLGSRKVLTVNDLWEVSQDLKSKVLSDRFSSKWEENTSENSKLIKVLGSALKWRLLSPILPRLCLLAFTICQPLLLERLLEFLQSSNESDNIGYGLIGAYGVVYLGMGISNSVYYYFVFRAMAVARGSLVTAIFERTINISITAIDHSAAVTLMSADVDKILNAMVSIHDFWANIIQVAISTWLLSTKIGAACVGPIIVCVVAVIGAVLISRSAAAKQVAWVGKVSRRVGITAEILAAMRGIKMLGLTDAMNEYLAELRRDELATGNAFRLIIVWTAGIAFSPLILGPAVTFSISFGINGSSSLDITQAFTSLTLIVLALTPLGSIFQAIPELVGAVGCCGRIETYMKSTSKLEKRKFLSTPSSSLTSETSSAGKNDKIKTLSAKAINVESGQFGWTEENTALLSGINIEIDQGTLAMIVGPVASGKTTLLKSFLSEVPYFEGSITLASSSISFCDQTPWIQNGTIRENIVGFAVFDSDWYSKVIHASALTEDLVILPKGDQTLVGSKGITLSGGQKQRVAIARATYAKKDISIFDDVFSGLDMQTQQAVFQRLFGPQGLLRNRHQTNIIATHSVNLLPLADKIIVLSKDGRVAEQGPFNQLKDSQGYISSLELEAPETKRNSEVSPLTKYASKLAKDADASQDAEDTARRDGDFKVYGYYFRSLGLLTAILYVFSEIAVGIFYCIQSVWLKVWTGAIDDGNSDTAFYLGIFWLLAIVGQFVLFFTCWLVLNPMVRLSGNYLHSVLLRVIMNAPMAFFNKTDVGVTTNRFSQDLQFVDWDFPLALLNTGASGAGAICQAILIAVSSGYIAITFPFIFIIFYFLQKFYLRTSRQLRFMDIESKSPLYTQFLEALSGVATIRAFGWQEDSEKLNKRLLDTSQKPQYLLYMIQRWLNLVLDLVVTGLSVTLVGIAVGLRHKVSAGFTGVALVNVITLATVMNSAIREWTQAETSIGAVSRIRALEKEVGPEHRDGENKKPPLNWPEYGEIKLESLCATYDQSSEKNEVDNVSLLIKSGQKVGICGRSGSGKSTLISTLLRLIEIRSGSIEVDGIDLETIPRNHIRSRLVTLPQESLLLAGATVRFNVDPYKESSDEQIRQALRKVDLLSVFEGDEGSDSGEKERLDGNTEGKDKDRTKSNGQDKSMSQKEGLDSELKIESLSHGQRQLFCLARAILRPGRIVILDEATSSVDKKTDEIMQRIIREEFAGRTLFAVAHRLETIVDFDIIVVMDKGKIIETGSPKQLLDTEGSQFKDLYQSSASKGTSS